MPNSTTSDSDLSSDFEAAIEYFRFLDSTDAWRLGFTGQLVCTLYCLYKQATVGCCSDRSPSKDATNIQRILHAGWAGLGSMSAPIAKECFIDLLEVVSPAWFAKYLGLDMYNVNNVTDVDTHAGEGNGQIVIDTCDRWVKLDIEGEKPEPRHQHGAVTAQGRMYVYGGMSENDISGDLEVLDLRRFNWSKLKLEAIPMLAGCFCTSSRVPPCAGYSMFVWDFSIFFVSGYTENSSDTTVIEYNFDSCLWQKVSTCGTAPRARMGQSVTLVGDSLVIFGGEVGGDKSNAIDILYLSTMRWVRPKTTGNPPCPRSRHISAGFDDQFLLVFGGESNQEVLSDLHWFEVYTCDWGKARTKGKTPSNLSCQAGVTIGINWFIVGFTCDGTGDSQTFMLDMSTFSWKVVTQGKGPTTFAKEGLSLVSSTYEGHDILVSFGGYNGSCSNEVHVLRPSYSQVTDIEASEELTYEDISIPEIEDLFTFFTPEKVLEATRKDGENHGHEKELSLPAGINLESKKPFRECSPSSGDVQDAFTLLFVAVKDEFQTTQSTNNNVKLSSEDRCVLPLKAPLLDACLKGDD